MVEYAYFWALERYTLNRHLATDAILAVDSNTGTAIRGEESRLESMYLLAVFHCRKLLR